jgi:type IV pilus assembly protein PilA
MMRRIRARGVTLVEVMIVVAIVGILAMLGLVGWRHIMTSSHTVEATQMVGAIRIAQERYHSEVGSYANISTNLAFSQSQHHDALYPHCTMSPVKQPGNFKVAWGGACTSTACCNGTPNWTSVQITTDAPVMYGYSTVAGNASTAPPSGIPIGGNTITYPNPIPGDWYMASAVGDVDGNGKFSTVIGTSFDNMIRVDMDGE